MLLRRYHNEQETKVEVKVQQEKNVVKEDKETTKTRSNTTKKKGDE